jgi:diacylglycerol kinase family enzyme
MMRWLALQVRVTWEADDVERFTKEALEAGVDTIVAAGGFCNRELI